MEPRKLLIFHLDDGRELRGGQRQLLYLVKELNLLGHLNHIVCRSGSPLEITARRKNFNTVSLPYFFEWDPVSAFLLKKKIKAVSENRGHGEPPVLHAHTSHAAAISYLASFDLNCVRIAHRRVDFIPSAGLSARFKYEKAHRVIAISKAVRDLMLSLGISGDKVAVVNSTVDLDETPWEEPALSEVEGRSFEAYRSASKLAIAQRFGLPQSAPWIGSLIALVPHKDPENFARAAALVLEKIPHAHFLLAGAGELAGNIKRLIHILKIEKNFHLLGYYETPYELLSALDIFVLPSSEEGLGSVLIEAMNSRLPIVATRAGGITEVIEDGANGIIVDIKSPAELARAQLTLLGDAPLRARIAAEGHRRRLDFSSPKMAELTLKIYEQELGRLKARGPDTAPPQA
ncbi:MAG: glycosyltransferase family 4 protein [Elusimicrobia bacterium]|nr:glycosyltransferase family 4 protein [Elusimicrobiota bacterium]